MGDGTSEPRGETRSSTEEARGKVRNYKTTVLTQA